MISPPTPEPAAPTAHPSVAWWASCPVITDRPPEECDADAFGQVLEGSWISGTGFRVQHWAVVEPYRGGWIHTASWRPLAPKPLTLGQRIDVELTANTEIAPELRALLLEAKAVVGEVVK